MSDTPETKVKKYFRRKLQNICTKAGVYLRISTRGSEFGAGGEPDYDCCIGGSVYFHAEIKAEGKRVKEGSRQDAKIKEMIVGGESVVVLAGKAEVDAFMREQLQQLFNEQVTYAGGYRFFDEAIKDEYTTQQTRSARERPGVPQR